MSGYESMRGRHCRSLRVHRCCSRLEGVEITSTIAVKNHVLGSEVLDRKTKGVKFDRTRVVTSEFVNGKKIVNERRNNENIVEMKGRAKRCMKSGITGPGDRYGRTIPDRDIGRRVKKEWN